MTKRISLYTALISFLFIGCSQPDNTSQTEEHEEHQEQEGNTVALNSEQLKSIQVQFGQIEQKQLTASLKANGILKVPNQNKASVTSLYGGVVKSILVQPGNSVRKGQTIATIANPQFIELQEEYLSIKAKVKYAELEYKRQKELVNNNAGALKTFQQSETELNTLQAQESSLQKQLDLIGVNTATLKVDNIASVIAITSPLPGAVSKVMVNIGSTVDISTPIAEVVDNSQLHLDLYIYEKDLPKIKQGQTIHFTLTNNPGKEYDAEIFGISNTFEDESKAIAVHAMVKGDKMGLIDGMSITALVSLENATVTAVPTDAIVSSQGMDYIFIVTEAPKEDYHEHSGTEEKEGHGHDHSEEEGGNHEQDSMTYFERIPVRKGTTEVGYSEITLLKDIPAGASVVTKGAFFLLAKMSNTGEHHH